MNRDDIIRMAREAGAGEPESLYGRTDYFAMTGYELERFAALVAAAEREACAQVCEEGGRDESGRIHVQAWGAAKDIRARGEK
jgi:hypothetical protein